MKKIGEISFSMIPSVKRTRAYWRASKQRVAATCKNCGADETQSQGQMRKYHSTGFICRKCQKKGQEELRQAITALNLRKSAQK
jgi:tRNA(Ile2) C34 agmatinyltransferase TiaS